MCLHFVSHQTRGLFNSLHWFLKKIHFRTSLLTHEFHLYHDFIIHTFDPFAINYILTLKLSKQSRYFPLRTALPPYPLEAQRVRSPCRMPLPFPNHKTWVRLFSKKQEKHFIVACCVLASGRGHSFSPIFIYRFIYRVWLMVNINWRWRTK